MTACSNKTKIIATIGPACNSRIIIEKLLKAGVNVFRLNFSHGIRDEHDKAITLVRKVSAALRLNTGILCDLQGPKLRTGTTKNDMVILLKKGTLVELTSRKIISDEKTIFIDYPHLVREVKEGQNILINDGAIKLLITKVSSRKGIITCRVINGGAYSSRKGVNLPDTRLSLQSMTAKDKDDLMFILTRDINFIALSFVRNAHDLAPLAEGVRSSGKKIQIIAKIEKPEAVAALDSILDVCDGIMVARGDLGVETSPAGMPILQKDAVKAANLKGKIVIVATQMLESMIENSAPTRAETTDVANAILDGTDAVMLSGETSVGRHPVEAVSIMRKIASATENSVYYSRHFLDLSLKDKHPPYALCEAANWASRDLGGAPLIVFTLSGNTACYLAKIRSQAPIYAFTPYTQVAQSLSLSWNIFSFFLKKARSIRILYRQAEKILIEKKLIRKGDFVVIIYGKMLKQGNTNILKINRIGEFD